MFLGRPVFPRILAGGFYISLWLSTFGKTAPTEKREGNAGLISAKINSLTSPLLGAQELDSDEPSLCVHQPGRTVNKECPRLRLPP